MAATAAAMARRRRTSATSPLFLFSRLFLFFPEIWIGERGRRRGRTVRWRPSPPRPPYLLLLHVLRALQDAARRVKAGEVSVRRSSRSTPATMTSWPATPISPPCAASSAGSEPSRAPLTCAPAPTPCARGAGAARGGRCCAWPAPSPARSRRGWTARPSRASLPRYAAAGQTPRALLAELEARLLSLSGRFDPRLQTSLLRHGLFSAVEAELGDPAVGGGCAVAVLALVRFNKDVFVGAVLMGAAVDALVASVSAVPLHALNGLVDAIQSPLVDELHTRGDLVRLVALLCASDRRARVPALGFVLHVGYYGRKEEVDALLADGLIEHLLCLQRSDLGGSLARSCSFYRGSSFRSGLRPFLTSSALHRRPPAAAVPPLVLVPLSTEQQMNAVHMLQVAS